MKKRIKQWLGKFADFLIAAMKHTPHKREIIFSNHRWYI